MLIPSLVTLTLLLQTTADWVEISQQHYYKKPVRSHFYTTERITTADLPNTTNKRGQDKAHRPESFPASTQKTRTQPSKSKLTSEPPERYIATQAVPTGSTVKHKPERVHSFADTTTELNKIKTRPNRIYINQDWKKQAVNLETITTTTDKHKIYLNDTIDHQWPKGSIKRISGNIGRVQYVKKPELILPTDDYRPTVNTIVTRNNSVSNNKTASNNNNAVQIEKPPNRVLHEAHDKRSFKLASLVNKPFHKDNPLDETISEPQTDHTVIHSNKPIKRINIPTAIDEDEPVFVTKQELPEDYEDIKHIFVDHEEYVPSTSSESSETTRRTELNAEEDFTLPPRKVTPAPQDHPEKIPDEDITEKPASPIANVVKFMKIVSDTITKNTHKSIKSKMKYLDQLKHTILANIEERIEEAWPDEPTSGGHRRTRAARGHVDFPSSEGALMTISFLTFAVFLIKLVMQVIHTYKNNSMVMTPTVLAVSRAASAARKISRNKD